MTNKDQQYNRYITNVMLVVAAGLILFGGYLLLTYTNSKIEAVQMIAMGIIVFGITPGMYKKD